MNIVLYVNSALITGEHIMYDLYEELQTKNRQLDFAVKDLRKNGTALAQAEMDYKIKLREEILKLRDEGVAVGIIDKICYGIPTVAELRYKRDICESIYKANQEGINSCKLQLKLLENQIQREYGNTKYE